MIKEYRTLFRYMKPYAWWYVAGLISLLVTGGFQLLIPQFIRQAIDTLGTPGFEMASIIRIIGFMLLTAMAVALGRLGWRYFLGTTARRIETSLREDLFSHLMSLDGSFYREHSIGDLMARSTNDMQTIRMAASMALVAAFDGIFLGIAILIIMFTQTPRLAAYTVIPLPAITVLLIFFGRLIGPLFRSVQEGFSSMSDHSQETFAGIRVIKSFVKEGFFAERFLLLNNEYRKRNMRLVSIHGFFFPFVMFLSGLTLMILLIVGGRQVIEARITAGDLVATLSYLQMLIWPMMGAGFTVNLIQRGAASLGRINRILETAPRIDDPEVPQEPGQTSDISIRNLSVKIDGQELLKELNIDIPEGSLVGITGPVGGGKTTLLNCLPRLTEFEGEILIGGVDSSRLKLQDLRSFFGYVPQRSFLFSASIRDNISFGSGPLTEDRFADLTRTASLNQDLKLFPQGWDTVVGERGVTISGGQKQRTSLARALAISPPILLLDDPLSAVDADTEERILSGLLEKISGRTTLLVSHRISTLRHCDLVLVIEGGRITQQGTHARLSADPGYYQKICEIQRYELEEQEGSR